MTSFRVLEAVSPGDWFYDVHDQLKQHVYDRSRRAFAAGDAARDALATTADVEARRRAIRSCLLEGIGGLPPSDTPLNDRVVGVMEAPAYRIEKVLFQSRPLNYVTANLYLPNGLTSPAAAVLFLCGHHHQGKHTPEYQMVCSTLATAGLVVLAQDPVGQGERLSYYEAAHGVATVGSCTTEHDYAGAQCLPLGHGIARYFLHDSMRTIDYLCLRPEVDGSRIGVTGNSGGGTQTSLVMLADTRIAAAAPATFIMNRETYMDAGGAQDAEQIWRGFTAGGFDHEDILIAMAPRPVCVLAMTEDFFPIEGTRRTVDRCKRIWQLFDRADSLELVEDVGGHEFTPVLARAAARFFSRCLLGAESGAPAAPAPTMDPTLLWCTRSGEARGELANAESVHEANRARLDECAAARSALPAGERRERATRWLRERVCRHRTPCALNPRFYYHAQVDELSVEAAIWWSQERMHSHGMVFRDLRLAGRVLPVTLCIWEGGTSRLHVHARRIRDACRNERACLVLDTSGVGGLRPRPITKQTDDSFYGTTHKLATDLVWLDDDLVSLRTFDVLRSLDVIASWPGLDPADIEALAVGRCGLYGCLAAALDPRVRSLDNATVEDMSAWVGARHYDTHDIYSVVLPGALEHFDVSELPPASG